MLPKSSYFSRVQVLEAAKELFHLGVESVLVKLGADGSLLLPGAARVAGA